MGAGEEAVVETTEEAPESQEQVVEGETATEASETEQAAEPTAEEQAVAEDQGFRIETDDKGKQYIVDEDGQRIPPKRFSEVYREAKEGERTKEKFDLYKRLGPEAYYKAFPDEKPQEETAPAERPSPRQPNVDIGALKVIYPDNVPPDQRIHEGMTLRELYSVDPVMATQLQNGFLDQQRREAEAEVSKTETFRKEASAEIETFAGSIATELFGKEAKALSKEEEGKVAGTIQSVLDWMSKTHRGGGIIADAYKLMTMEEKLNNAKTKTATAVVDSLRKTPVGHIGSGPSTQAADNFESMTETQLSETVSEMSDSKKEEFYKKASPALRKKFPSWPWD
jgi:hypothetical protein